MIQIKSKSVYIWIWLYFTEMYAKRAIGGLTIKKMTASQKLIIREIGIKMRLDPEAHFWVPPHADTIALICYELDTL